MTKAEIDSLMDSVGIYYDKDHPDHIEREKIDTLTPPFLEFEVEEQSFFADNIVYFTTLSIEARIYSDVPVDKSEVTLKAELTKKEMPFSVKKNYVEDWGLWETRIITSATKS